MQITKRTKDSRTIDSASGGMGKTMAREIRGLQRIVDAYHADLLEAGKRISIEVYQEDWIPGFAAFHDDGNLKETAKAHVVLNLAANLLAVEDGDIPKSDLPYIIAENIMHEVIHVLEAWCDQEFSEERVEALLTKYRDKYKPDAPAYTNPTIGSEFPKESSAGAASTGVSAARDNQGD